MKTKWVDMYSLLEKFVSEKKRLPTAADKDQGELIQWVKERQSEIINNKKMIPERKKLLQKITVWEKSVPHIDDEWGSQLGKLKTFLEETGRYPESVTDSDVYVWLRKQRGLKKQHNHEHWNQMKESLLGALPGFYWSTEDPAYWTYFSDQIQRLGRLPVQKSDKFETKLFKWLSAQRSLYEKNEVLTQEQRDKIEEIYGGKDKMNTDPWFGNFNDLKAWVETNGRLPEQFAWLPEEQSHYKWVCNQKKRRLQQKPDGSPGLSEEKQQLLATFAGWDWDLDPISFWDKMIEECYSHHTKNMSSFKSKKTMLPEEKKICGWYNFTNSKFKSGSLTDERREKFAGLLERIRVDNEKTVNPDLVEH